MKSADYPKPVPPPPFPAGRFSIISADPSWMYRDRKSCDPALGGFRYPPMKLEDIMALPVRDLAESQCALFLWCPPPHVAQGHHHMVAAAWGFELVTKAFCWVKTNPKTDASGLLLPTQAKGGGLRSGQGHYVAGNTEDCFLGFNCSPRLKRQSKMVKQLIFQRVTEHSAKPPEALERMVKLFGDLPRIELFARVERGQVGVKQADGWARWGVEKDDRLALPVRAA